MLAYLALATTACDPPDSTSVDEDPAAALPAGSAVPADRDGVAANRPDEIYFDLTAFPWYREGRPLMHGGRAYLPQSDPTTVDVELREAGRFEGVVYYVAEGSREPVYTLYVPVYYRYWQRFTSPLGT